MLCNRRRLLHSNICSNRFTEAFQAIAVCSVPSAITWKETLGMSLLSCSFLYHVHVEQNSSTILVCMWITEIVR